MKNFVPALLLLAACGDSPATSASGSSAASAAKSVAKSASAAAKPAATPSTSSATSAASATSSDASPAVSGSAAASAAPASTPPADKGQVKLTALIEGFKKEPAAWLGASLKTKGAITSITNNAFILDKGKLMGPDDKGTLYAVYLRDDVGEKGPTVGCLLEAGSVLTAAREAFMKSAGGAEVVLEVEGTVEGSFGSLAPCKVLKQTIARAK